MARGGGEVAPDQGVADAGIVTAGATAGTGAGLPPHPANSVEITVRNASRMRGDGMSKTNAADADRRSVDAEVMHSNTCCTDQFLVVLAQLAIRSQGNYLPLPAAW
jgi:hypothetical protein